MPLMHCLTVNDGAGAQVVQKLMAALIGGMQLSDEVDEFSLLCKMVQQLHDPVEDIFDAAQLRGCDGAAGHGGGGASSTQSKLYELFCSAFRPWVEVSEVSQVFYIVIRVMWNEDLHVRICRAPPPRGPSNWTSSSSVRFISLKSTKNLSKYVVLEREAEQEVRVVSEDEN